MLADRQFDQLNSEFEKAHPKEILTWAIDTYWPDIVASSSFQTQGVPLLHMLYQLKPDIPIIFLDTGYHFSQTLSFRDRLVREWGLTLRIVRAIVTKDRLVQQDGYEPYRRDPDMCCYVNKVAPMKQAIKEQKAWISGIRRDQSPARAKTQILERMTGETIRIHPLATWTEREVWQYLHDHNLPEHPLLAKGYLSVGCEPCTQPVYAGHNHRAGRWAGQTKTECGLHTFLRSENNQRQPLEQMNDKSGESL